MNSEIRKMLEGVRQGTVSVDDALLALKKEPFTDIGYAKVDLHRGIRQGAAEVIYGMDTEALGIIADAAAPYFAGEKSAPDVAAEVQSRVATYMAEHG